MNYLWVLGKVRRPWFLRIDLKLFIFRNGLLYKLKMDILNKIIKCLCVCCWVYWIVMCVGVHVYSQIEVVTEIIGRGFWWCMSFSIPGWLLYANHFRWFQHDIIVYTLLIILDYYCHIFSYIWLTAKLLTAKLLLFFYQYMCFCTV